MLKIVYLIFCWWEENRKQMLHWWLFPSLKNDNIQQKDNVSIRRTQILTTLTNLSQRTFYHKKLWTNLLKCWKIHKPLSLQCSLHPQWITIKNPPNLWKSTQQLKWNLLCKSMQRWSLEIHSCRWLCSN